MNVIKLIIRIVQSLRKTPPKTVDEYIEQNNIRSINLRKIHAEFEHRRQMSEALRSQGELLAAKLIMTI